MSAPEDSTKGKQVQFAWKQASDYATALDALTRISQRETEEDAIRGILQLIHMLFLPKVLHYVAWTDEGPDKLYALDGSTQSGAMVKQRSKAVGDPYSYTDSENGFRINIGFGGNDFGIVEVDDVEFPEHLDHYLNLMISIAGVCGLAIENAKRHQVIKEAEQELRKEKEKLEEALANIKTLSGLLPICSHCKKIRDDQGYWNSIESFVHEHSEAEFTHSICMDCAKAFYPDLDIYDP